jgi:hypothetical protein
MCLDVLGEGPVEKKGDTYLAITFDIGTSKLKMIFLNTNNSER